MRRLLAICLVIGWLPLGLKANDQQPGLKAKIKQLVLLRQAVINADTDQKRLDANHEFLRFMRDALAEPASFTTPFDTIPQLSDLRSSDDYFRLINWNVPLDDQTHRYHAFIQFFDKKSKAIKTVELKQGYRGVEDEHRKVFNENDWYGALYYDIIPAKGMKKNNKRTYMLLGWDGHNRYSRIKLVDALIITANSVRFGADLFDIPERNAKRMILEYKHDAAVSLRFDSKTNAFVFNRLEPMEPDLAGMPEFQISLLEFDALKWKNGKWRLVSDYDARNEDNDAPYVFPPSPQRN